MMVGKCRIGLMTVRQQQMTMTLILIGAILSLSNPAEK